MRSKLFVPASRADLFGKAMASAADAVSFDLQDAVEESRKPAARAALGVFLRTLAPGHGKVVVVRINGLDTPHHESDLDVAVQEGVDLVNLPVAESTEAVREVADRMRRLESARHLPRPLAILVNIESARGVRRAAELAGAHERVAGLQLGYGDLFTQLGIALDNDEAKQHVRIEVRMAAAAGNVPAYDGAYVHIDNPEGYRRVAQAACRLGFAGKSCIHPSQVAIANAAFRPSTSEIEHALRVMKAARSALASGQGAFVVDGRLVDGPFIRRAERTVAIARSLGLLDGGRPNSQ